MCSLNWAAELYALCKTTVPQWNSRVQINLQSKWAAITAPAGHCSHFILEKGMGLRHIPEIVIIGIFPDIHSLIIQKQEFDNHPVSVLTIESIQLKHFLDFISSCSCLSFDLKRLHQNWISYKQQDHVFQCEENSGFFINLDWPQNDLGEDKIIRHIWLSSVDCVQRGEKRIYGNEWCKKKRSADLQSPEEAIGQIAVK